MTYCRENTTILPLSLKDGYPGLPHETLPQRAALMRATLGPAASCCQQKMVDTEKISLAYGLSATRRSCETLPDISPPDG
jgi:hypothetical protein